MDTLWCYDDEEGWGRDLLSTAIARGIEAHLFNATDLERVPRGALAFVHMHHSKAWNGRPERRERDKGVMAQLARRGVLTIPCQRNAALYDDKSAQLAAFAELMPRTEIYTSRHDARHTDLQWPIVSKAAQGAGSHNVRLLPTPRYGQREIDTAFAIAPNMEGPHVAATGIPLRYGERQRGYLLWQEFHAGNPYDYRVIRIGSKRMILRRWNRDDVPFASGSGKIDPIRGFSAPIDVTTASDAVPQSIPGPSDITPEVLAVLESANHFFELSGFTWSGIDLIRCQHSGRWLLLECTVGWTMAGYADCVILDANGVPVMPRESSRPGPQQCPSALTGVDVWNVLLDEIIAGNMGSGT